MKDLGFYLIAVPVVLVVFVVILKRQLALKELAEARHPLSREEFIKRMARDGVSGESGETVWDIARRCCSSRITPYPEDRWSTTLRVNPEELQDETARLAVQNEWDMFGHPTKPGFLDDPSLIELGRYIDKIRRPKAA
jgi:hypothetical protein